MTKINPNEQIIECVLIVLIGVFFVWVNIPESEANLVKLHGRVVSNAQIKGTKKKGKYLKFDFVTDQSNYLTLRIKKIKSAVNIIELEQQLTKNTRIEVWVRKGSLLKHNTVEVLCFDISTNLNFTYSQYRRSLYTHEFIPSLIWLIGGLLSSILYFTKAIENPRNLFLVFVFLLITYYLMIRL